MAPSSGSIATTATAALGWRETQYASGMPRGHELRGKSRSSRRRRRPGSTWMRRFGDISTGFASGWMRVRGARRRRAVDRGFVLSDHVDWPSILSAVEATGATRVWVTHGTREPLVRWLTERGIDAQCRRQSMEGRGGHGPGGSRRRGDHGVKAFARLFSAIDETMRTNEKVDAMVDYFRSAEPADAAWAVWFLSGGRPKRLIPVRRLAAWAMEETDVPDWLFAECYDAVGDLAETMSLLLPDTTSTVDVPLHRWIADRLLPLASRARSRATREHRAELARARRDGAFHLEQAHHGRIPRRRVAAARGASAVPSDGRGRRRDRAPSERHVGAARGVVHGA